MTPSGKIIQTLIQSPIKPKTTVSKGAESLLRRRYRWFRYYSNFCNYSDHRRCSRETNVMILTSIKDTFTFIIVTTVLYNTFLLLNIPNDCPCILVRNLSCLTETPHTTVVKLQCADDTKISINRKNPDERTNPLHLPNSRKLACTSRTCHRINSLVNPSTSPVRYR